MSRKLRALVVIPCFQAVYPRPLKNFLEIALVAGRTCPDVEFGIHIPERQSLVAAMNTAADIVRQQRWDMLIAFDDDCFPPYDCIPRLIQHYRSGHQYVAGVGVMRNFPFTTTVGRYYEEGPTLVVGPSESKVSGFYWLDDIDELPPLAEADFCGMPVALIGREVLEAVVPPAFGVLDEHGGACTHDVYFARKVKAAGFPVHVDTTIRCAHLTEAPIVTFENRTAARQLAGYAG